MGGIVPPNLSHGEHQSLQCFPLYSFLLALANPTVHLLSLDIEGAEFEVKAQIHKFVNSKDFILGIQNHSMG